MAADDLGAIVDAARDAVITADDEGLIVSFNPASERMFGYAGPRGQSRRRRSVGRDRFAGRRRDGDTARLIHDVGQPPSAS